MSGFGFVTRAERVPKRSRALFDVAHLHKLECAACPLNRAANIHPKIPASGAKRPRLYVLGEAPGKTEDEQGRQFVGKAGERLRRELFDANDVVTEDDVRMNNVIRDRPPDNRTPEPVEIECCRPSIVRDIEASKPPVILSCGAPAAEWFGLRGGIGLWRGRILPVKVGAHSAWLAPVLPPSFVMRTENAGRDETELKREMARTFGPDIRRALWVLENAPAPRVWGADDFLPPGSLFTPPNSGLALPALEDALRSLEGPISVDLEWEGDRPYAKNARILSISVSSGARTVAVGVQHDDARLPKDELRSLFRKAFLRWWRGRPVFGHHSASDLEWLVWWLGTEMFDLDWHCTMAQGYVLDERQGGLSLGFLTRVNFGTDVKELTRVDSKHAASAKLPDLLRYNALDAAADWHLFRAQNETLKRRGLADVYGMQRQRIPSFVWMERHGFLVDPVRVAEFDASYEKKIAKADTAIRALPDVRSFERQYGPVNFGSSKQLVRLFKDHLHLIDGNSTDEEILAKVDHPVAASLLLLRNLTKQRSTYVKPFMPGTGSLVWPDGRLHAQFKETGTDTARSASSGPNMQNFPKRKHKEARGILVPGAGRCLLAVDFGQHEYRIIGCATRDKVIVDSIVNRYDVHIEWAKKLAARLPYLLKRQGGDMKALRAHVKNKFVFPAFYTAGARSIAGYLEIPDKDFPVFAEIYDEFRDFFKGVVTWQDEMLSFYQARGYVRSLAGRRRHAPLTRSQVCNTPIQSAAFDVVADAQARVFRIARETERPWLAPFLNIHDDLTFEVPVKKVDEALSVIVPTLLNTPFPWVTVPLAVEVERGSRWDEMKPVGVYYGKTAKSA